MTTTDGQASTGFSLVTKDQLKAIIDVFTRITWPASASAADRLMAELGWERTRLRVAHTGLPVKDDAAGIGLADGVDGVDTIFTDIDLRVTDSGKSLAVEDLWDAFRLISSWITEIVGTLAATEYGDIPESPTVWWDLPSGGGLKLTLFGTGLTMYLLSKGDADMERFDRDHPECTTSRFSAAAEDRSHQCWT